jgi:hypothetical protein
MSGGRKKNRRKNCIIIFGGQSNTAETNVIFAAVI